MLNVTIMKAWSLLKALHKCTSQLYWQCNWLATLFKFSGLQTDYILIYYAKNWMIWTVQLQFFVEWEVSDDMSRRLTNWVVSPDQPAKLTSDIHMISSRIDGETLVYHCHIKSSPQTRPDWTCGRDQRYKEALSNIIRYWLGEVVFVGLL